MINITAAIDNLLWQKDLTILPRWQVMGIKLLRIFQAVIRDLKGGLLTLRAMSLVYTTLLSLVPLLAVSFSVLKGFGVHNQIDAMLLKWLKPFGEQSAEITKQIISFVDKMEVGVVGFIGLGLLLYTVVSLIQKIENAFNFTWRITSSRNMTQRFSNYLSVIMVGPVLIFSAMGITASVSNSDVLASIAAIEPFGTLILFASKLLPYLLVIAAFTFIYILIPNTRVRFRSALVGGIISGILWETTGWLFASFVVNSSNYTAIYSGFAILMIFMIWLYLSWLIVLTGASIAFYHQNPGRVANRQQVLTMSCRLREKTALMAMYRIGQSFHDNKPAWDHERLAMNIDIASEALAMVVDSLLQADLITMGGKDGLCYLPAHSLDQISVKTILDTVRAAEETQYLSPESLNSGETIEQLLNTLDTAVSQSLNEMSLRDLITQTRPEIK